MNRNIPLKNTLFRLIGFCLILVAGCASLTSKQGQPRSALQPLEEGIPPTVYPETFTLNQRIILTIDDKEYDFVGYLAAERDRGFRAMTFGEMGGKVFDFVLAGNNVKVIRKPDNIPLQPIADGVIGDIRHIYFEPEFRWAYKLKENEENRSLIILENIAWQDEYHYGADKKLLYSKEFFENRLIREAEYLDYHTYPGWEKPLPSKIRLVNHRWNYTMDITLIKIKEGIKRRNQEELGS